MSRSHAHPIAHTSPSPVSASLRFALVAVTLAAASTQLVHTVAADRAAHSPVAIICPLGALPPVTGTTHRCHGPLT